MIGFDEKTHTYRYLGDDPKYKSKKFVSTTTFIGWFKNPFDAEYWSLYKAIKDFYEGISEESWVKFKVKAGGWEKVVQFYLNTESRFEKIVAERIRGIQKGYLNLWNDQKEASTKKGSSIHKDLEDDAFNAKAFVGDKGKIHSVQQSDFFYHKVDPVSIKSFPECIVYNLDFMISGMVDRVDKDGIELDIYDYKTNIKIETLGFRDQRMKVVDLPDANYYHYLLQMSIYGWMLERFGYKVRSLNLEHLITENRYSKKVVDIVQYQMEYRPDLVEKMLVYRNNKHGIK